MAVKEKTYTVMHSAGEKIAGKRYRPYEKFKSLPTPELEEKVKKGFLLDGSEKKSTKKAAAKKK